VARRPAFCCRRHEGLAEHDTKRSLGFRRSIRTKLAAIVGLAVVLAGGAVGTVGYINSRQILFEQIHARFSAESAARRELLQQYISQQLERAGLVASRTRLRHLLELRDDHAIEAGAFAEETSRIVDDVLRDTTGFSTVCVVDAAGRAVASTDPAYAGRDFGGDHDYLAAREGRVFGEPLSDGEGHFAWVGAPARTKDGRDLGVVMVLVDVDPLVRLMTDASGLGETSEVRVAGRDRDGVRYLLPVGPDGDTTHAPLDDVPMMAAATAGHTGFMRATDERGVEVLAAYGPVGYADWGLVAQIDVAEAYAPVLHGRTMLAATQLSILAVVLVAAFMLARRVTRPVRGLTRTAARVASGEDYAQRATRTTDDEVGVLTDAFNHMLAQIERRDAELRVAQRDLERRVSESDRRLRAVAETATDAIVSADHSGTVTYCNEAAEAMFGYPASDVVGRPMTMLMPERYRVAHRGGLRRYVETGRGRVVGKTVELEALGADGSEFPVELSLASWQASDGTRAFTGIIRNIAERKRTESALRYRVEFETLITHLAADFINLPAERLDEGITAALGRLATFASVDRATIFLLNEDHTAVSSTHEWNSEGHEPLISRMQELPLSEYRWLAAQLVEGETVHVPDIECLGDDAAAEREFLKSLGLRGIVDVPLVARQGPIGFLGFGSFEPDRQWPEESVTLLTVAAEIFVNAIERKQSAGTLAAYAEELETSNAELERSNAELEEFAYAASHDLQEPLRMVAGYCGLLQRRYGDRLGDDADEFIGYAVDGAVRMQQLITDLLTYSRVGRRGGELASTDCEDVLGAAVANLHVAIEETEAVVTHDPLPSVVADESELAQVFQNLIGNAIKFHGDTQPRVHVSAELVNGACMFSVRDNGIGIEARHARRIFSVFQRLHNHQDYPGTGIGLAICKKIVERHRGHIWVQSAPGNGSTFYFTVPPVDAELRS